MSIGNALVGGVLRSPVHRMMSRSLMLLTYRGRRSGKEYTIPVGYVPDGEEIIVIAGRAQAKSWWTNLRGPQQVGLLIGSRRLTGEARLATAEEAPQRLATYLEQMRRAAKAFGVPRCSDGRYPEGALERAAAEHQVILIRVGQEG